MNNADKILQNEMEIVERDHHGILNSEKKRKMIYEQMLIAHFIVKHKIPLRYGNRVETFDRFDVYIERWDQYNYDVRVSKFTRNPRGGGGNIGVVLREYIEEYPNDYHNIKKLKKQFDILTPDVSDLLSVFQRKRIRKTSVK